MPALNGGLFFQPAVDALEVFFVEFAGCGGQAQQRQNIVVARLSEITAGTEQLLLRVQYIDLCAYADLLAKQR